MSHTRRSSILLACALALSVGCRDGDTSQGPTSPAASTYDSTVPVAWADLLYAAIQAESTSAPVASRIVGYVGVTAYEAAVDGMPSHRSLGGQLNGLDPLPPREQAVHDWEVVSNSALAAIMKSLFAGASAPTLAAIDALELQLGTQLQAGDKPETYTRSVDRGQAIAAAIFAWASTDGFSTWDDCAYTAPTGAGLWVPTPLALAPPVQPCWGKLRPFSLLFGAECSALAPPAYSTAPGSTFYLQALEVRDTVDNLTVDQLDAARFWTDEPVTGGTHAAHWLEIASEVAVQNDLPFDVCSEAFARVGIAVADAFISSWDMAYYYDLLRPITFIHDPAAINDPTWTTADDVDTPSSPEYTASHAVSSGAVAHVLTDLLGNLSFQDDIPTGLPARSFTSFTAAADEAAISRMYAGFDFRASAERGVEQGRCVGQLILDDVQFLR